MVWYFYRIIINVESGLHPLDMFSELYFVDLHEVILLQTSYEVSTEKNNGASPKLQKAQSKYTRNILFFVFVFNYCIFKARAMGN